MARDRFGLVLDFDGTISRMAPRPELAAISPRSAAALRRIVGRFALVSVMSGRAVADTKARLGMEGVVYVGNHGVEYLDGEQLDIAPGVTEHRDKIERLLRHVRETVRDPGLFFQDKYYSASVHFRLSEDKGLTQRMLEGAVESSVDASALDIFWGKQVLEMRAPVGVTKGYAMRKLVNDYRLNSAMFIGDDTTDLDAITAVRQMSGTGGFEGMGVAVVHHDSPRAVVKGSDYTLDELDEVEALLEWMAE